MSFLNGAFEPPAGSPRESLLNGKAPLAAPPTQADAWDANSKAYGDWVEKERADGVAKGLLDPETGLPTKAGLEDAARQLAQAVMMGTTAPGARGAGGDMAKSSLRDVLNEWTERGIDHHVSENNGYITVSKIKVPTDQQGRGIGTQAMQSLNDYADATGQRVALSPSKDFGASSLSRLTDFYKNLGFKANKGRTRDFTTQESMLREPDPSAAASGKGDQ